MDRIDRELLARLSVRIGMIFEDEVVQAVSTLPAEEPECAFRFARLRAAGRDIELLGAAAEVILQRSIPGS